MKEITYTPVILAGGRSRRMGTNKAFVLHQGKPLIQHVIELLKPFGNPIHISGSVVDYQHLGFPVIEDRLNDKGPLGALDAILHSIATDYALVLPVDCPNIRRSTIERLLSEARPQATVPRDPLHIHPLIGLYHKSCLYEVRHALERGQLAATALLAQLQVHYLIFDEPDEFQNLNFPHQIEP